MMTQKTDIGIKESVNNCSLGGICGGCFYAGKKYSDQLSEKNERVKVCLSEYEPGEKKAEEKKAEDNKLPDDGINISGLTEGSDREDGLTENSSKSCKEDFEYLGIIESPIRFGYRNKMEYSFGDCMKDGPLTLGMHRKKSFYDVIDVDCCLLVHSDCNLVTKLVAEYFRELGVTYKDKRSHKGYLRHLIIRRAVNTGEMLIDLVTTSQKPVKVKRHADIYAADLFNEDGSLNPSYGAEFIDEAGILEGFKNRIIELEKSEDFEGTVRGILHTVNDSMSDAVRNDRTDILYGEDHITEEILGLKFDISPFSFFQTNTLGAEVLYSKAREFISEFLDKDMTVYDLYTGTGTIAQLLAPCVKEVTGVEIVEEAVEAAKVNAARNGLDNCTFIADDVLKALDSLGAPDMIVLDPPRDGVNPKALKKLISYDVKHMLYISCKPESLKRDLVTLRAAGYHIVKAAAVDQFPWTNNVETIALLSKL